MATKIAIGADHGGFSLKEKIKEFLSQQGYGVIDVGAHSQDPVDYPDYALAVAKAILRKDAEMGIVVCGSGVGASVACNKAPGIRAGLCHDTFSAHQGREDDDMNVLCLGARVIGEMLALDVVKAWLNAKFSGAERHVKRLHKIADIEKEFGTTGGDK